VFRKRKRFFKVVLLILPVSLFLTLVVFFLSFALAILVIDQKTKQFCSCNISYRPEDKTVKKEEEISLSITPWSLLHILFKRMFLLP
jgi:hypothetical protein